MSISLASSGTMAATGDRVEVEDSIGGDSGSGAWASITIEVKSDGEARLFGNSAGEIQAWDWLLTGSASDYDVRVTKTTGDDPFSGSLNVWQNLGTTRSWEWRDTDSSFSVRTDFEGLLEIRDASSGVVLDSGTIDVFANRTAA